jgi:hypothetical protein
MKFLLLQALMIITLTGWSQNLQLHYDFRHSIDPKLNPKNFPMFSFEYFREIDTSGTGSFLLKLQTDLSGKNNNVSQVFSQLTQTIKFWKPKVYLGFNYSGGLGVTSSSTGFYLVNSLGIGVSYPFQWKGAWVATNLLFRYSAFDSPSYDPQLTVYFGKGFFNYRLFLAGSFTFWTENKNQGNDYTRGLTGKKFAFFGDPQIWYTIRKGFSIGSRTSVFYNLLGENKQIQFYPTIGVKYQFK